MSQYDIDKLHERIAVVLSWSVSDVQAHSLPALRDLVRPVASKLAHEITRAIAEGAHTHTRPKKSAKPQSLRGGGVHLL